MIFADPKAALAAIARNDDPRKRFVVAFERGTLSVEMYAPRERDAQQPHKRDELYVVYAGSGEFVLRDARRHFGPGSVLFVPAGAAHRFEQFTDDFSTWVIFCGPEGGERTEASS